MFVGASREIKYVIGAKIATGLGVPKYIFGLVICFGASHHIKYSTSLPFTTWCALA